MDFLRFAGHGAYDNAGHVWRNDEKQRSDRDEIERREPLQDFPSDHHCFDFAERLRLLAAGLHSAGYGKNLTQFPA